MGHQHQAERVQHRAGAQHAQRAEAVGDRAGERLADAPEQNSGSPAQARTRRGPSDWRPTSASGKSRASSAGRKSSEPIRQPKQMTTTGVRQVDRLVFASKRHGTCDNVGRIAGCGTARMARRQRRSIRRQRPIAQTKLQRDPGLAHRMARAGAAALLAVSAVDAFLADRLGR